MHFVATNTPFIATDMRMSPLSNIDDGHNDIVMLTFENGGTCRLGRCLIDMEEGNSFNEDGTIRRQQLGMDYIKCQSWELYPTIKGPPNFDDSVAFQNT